MFLKKNNVLNKTVGDPDEPSSVGISWSNSKLFNLFISLILPLPGATSSPKGYPIQITSKSLYCEDPYL